MVRILLVDNYDSFTYNLVHAIEAVADENVEVRRVDHISLPDLKDFQILIFSPGPGLPTESPNLIPLISEAMRLEKPILGVCLGMQALAVADGGALKNLKHVHHGVANPLLLSNPESVLFKNCAPKDPPLSAGVEVGRYHSWVVDRNRLSSHWKITSHDADGEIMSIEHRDKPFFGIQFHPESVLTPAGRSILKNFFDDVTVIDS